MNEEPIEVPISTAKEMEEKANNGETAAYSEEIDGTEYKLIFGSSELFEKGKVCKATSTYKNVSVGDEFMSVYTHFVVVEDEGAYEYSDEELAEALFERHGDSTDRVDGIIEDAIYHMTGQKVTERTEYELVEQ